MNLFAGHADRAPGAVVEVRRGEAGIVARAELPVAVERRKLREAAHLNRLRFERR